MFCPKCATRNENDARFCEACGAELVDNQPSLQSLALESAKIGLRQGADQLRKGAGQLSETIKNWPKGTKLLSIAVMTLIAALIAFSVIGHAATDPKNIVRGYFDARINGDWDAMFDYLLLEESEFVNKDSFSKYMENERQLEIVNFEVSDSLSDSGMVKTYAIQYLPKGNASVQTQTVSLVKTSGKRLLFFDDYRISAENLIVSDYSVHAPKNAAVYIDNIELTRISGTGQDDSYALDVFGVPEIFPGIHALRVEYSECEPFTDTIHLGVNAEREYYVQGLTLKASVQSGIIKKAEEAYRQIIAAVLAGDGFDTLNFSLTSSAEELYWLEDSYNYFVSAFKKTEGDEEVKNISVVRFTENIYGGMGVSGAYSFDLLAEYDYVIASKGQSSEYASSGQSTATFTYYYENGEWVLSGFYLGELAFDFGNVPVVPVVAPVSYSIDTTVFSRLGKTPEELADMVGAYDGTEWVGGYFHRFGNYWFGFDDYDYPTGLSQVALCSLADIIFADTAGIDYIGASELDILFGSMGQYSYDESGNRHDGGYIAYDYRDMTITIGCDSYMNASMDASVWVYAPHTAIASDVDYILPFSNTRLLTDADLRGLTTEELRIARNEIYARYGRQFSDQVLRDYFNGKSWYAAIPKLPDGTEPAISDLELSNAELIRSYEEE